MDFVSGFPRSPNKNDKIWVIVDRLTKSAHFLPIKTTKPSKLVELYMREIVRLHGVPTVIVSDGNSSFTLRFWGSLQKAMGKKLSFNTAFHPRTDGQSKRMIQTLEDMLCMCVLDFGSDWEKHLPLVEFAYNNGFQSSIGMTPYEALYGCKCRSPVCWTEVGERRLLGPKIV